jgi:hypothetical protein
MCQERAIAPARGMAASSAGMKLEEGNGEAAFRAAEKSANQ